MKPLHRLASYTEALGPNADLRSLEDREGSRIFDSVEVETPESMRTDRRLAIRRRPL